jgi:REP element-mobilizing transposase RayT/Mor family transcriptional regulator
LPRSPRINLVGCHHIIDRGIAHLEIFPTNEDKDKFLELVCINANVFDFKLHSYCIMNHKYHLLIETSQTNLSIVMRTINQSYSYYFNKKYKRVGHLWNSRFKSWFINDPEYRLKIFRYIEQIPYKSNAVQKVEDYKYSSYPHLMQPLPPKCLKNSFILRDFKSKEVLESFMNNIIDDHKEYELIKEFRMASADQYISQRVKLKPLSEYFPLNVKYDQEQRDNQIIQAYREGYSQCKIAKHLGVSQYSISKIIKKLWIYN